MAETLLEVQDLRVEYLTATGDVCIGCQAECLATFEVCAGFALPM